jgi:NAD(P)-dependent dehydrogenase (short-subunit alcohol dehydrogenase family)
MTEKTVLITGCSSGIGKCTAEGLAARGYRVFATARHRDDIATLQTLGLETLQLDLNDSSSIRAAVDEILKRTSGTLDALFNNAGYGQPGAVEDLSRNTLRAQFETNLFGMQELTNLIIPVMRAQGHGRIINHSSVLGFVTLPYRGAYNASKYAMEALTDTMRMELRDTGIHVSLIEPGPVISRFRANAYTAYKRNIMIENSPHRDTYLSMEKRLTRPGIAAPFTLPPEAVLKKVIHALESPRPRIRYYVTVPTYLFAVLKRILPYRALDWVLIRVSKGENR